MLNFDYYANVPKSSLYVDILTNLSQTVMNPHSNHVLAESAKEYSVKTHEILDKLFPMYSKKTFISGGGSVANSRAILGTMNIKHRVNNNCGDVVLISSVEHSSITKYISQDLVVRGYTVVVFPVTIDGVVNMEEFERLLHVYDKRIVFVSCMYINNEIGTIQPINNMVKLVKLLSPDILFHSDCGGHIMPTLDAEFIPDILTMSMYKFGAPHMGLMVHNTHMRNFYDGTPDVISEYACAKILDEYVTLLPTLTDVNRQFKHDLINALIPMLNSNNIVFRPICDDALVAPDIWAFILPQLKSSIVQTDMSRKMYAIGSGSACTTNEGSHTLTSIGYNSKISQRLIRLSFNALTICDTSHMQQIINNFCVDLIESVLLHSKLYMSYDLRVNPSIPKVLNTCLRECVDHSIMNLFTPLPNIKWNCIKVTYAEIHLKGKNRNVFVRSLLKIIKQKISTICTNYVVDANHSHFMIKIDDEYNDGVVQMLSKISGITTITPISTVTIKDFSQDEFLKLVQTYASSLYEQSNHSTFAIRAHTKTKIYELDSKDLEYNVGQYVKSRFNAKVNLSKPDVQININVEDVKDSICVSFSSHTVKGIGGLPISSTGSAYVVYHKDFVLRPLCSSIMLATRGVTPIPLFFECGENIITVIITILQQFMSFVLHHTYNNTNAIVTKIKELDVVEFLCIELNNVDYVQKTRTLKSFGNTTKYNVISTTLHLSSHDVALLSSKYFDNIDVIHIDDDDDNSLCKIIDEKSQSVIRMTDVIPNTKGLCLLSGGIDSPVASYELVCRGLIHDYVHFIESIDDTESKTKITNIVKKINPDAKIYFVEFGRLQKEIVTMFASTEGYRVIMYKVFMTIIANDIAQENGYKYLIMGNAIGQVASQTSKNLHVTNVVSSLPIVAPLLCLNKEDIIARAKAIGTFEISICNSMDCCVMYMPKYPTTGASTKQVLKMISQFHNYKEFILIITA
jgi:adenylyl- and sulfurtransferase ThiI/cysteine sulfinate desulfinase/cysteine desulfurase-like protein